MIKKWIIVGSSLLLGLGIGVPLVAAWQLGNLIGFIIVFISLILSIHSAFTLVWMLYAWENPDDAERHTSPGVFVPAHFTFTALVPARNEENVISATIRAISAIEYPEQHKELLILCREDDDCTIHEAKRVIEEIGKPNIRVVVFDGHPINKPHALNIGLRRAAGDVITIFDAEDQPHKDIYNIVNTLMVTEGVDVVQSGVQLMNYQSRWFSSLNCLEYFFWFKSGLHFFSRLGNVIPLAGNTAFFKKRLLEQIGGWDEECLTEDAEVGFRLAREGATMRVVYDERHTTLEETPPTVASFITQRTRWNHGFLQVLFKSDWLRLPQLRQKLLSVYLLLSPELHVALMMYLPVGLWVGFHHQLSVPLSMFSFLPLYLLGLQLMVYIVGLYEFCKLYQLKFSLWMVIKTVAVFFPYQILLTISSFRATVRFVLGRNQWEKTSHLNAHRVTHHSLFFTTQL